MEAAKIKAIRKYLSLNGVQYYDVQAELIDHFATAVENIQKENPDMRFKGALMKAHRAFGGREGFEKYIRQAENEVEKQTLKIIGRSLLHFLQWPYVLLTAGIVGFWYMIHALLPSVTLMFILFTVLFGCVILTNIWRVNKVKMFLPKRANTVLWTTFYFVCYLPAQPFLYHSRESVELNEGFLISWYSLCTILIVVYACIPKLTVERTCELYPQMGFSLPINLDGPL